MDAKKTTEFVNGVWDESIVDTLVEYVKIPNMSPAFDPEWATNGHQEKAVKLFEDWVASQAVPNLTCEVVVEQGRTPVIFCEVPGTDPNAKTVLLYGHLDKQPPFDGWLPGLGPWTPVIREDKLYGRGASDDGYAIFSAITAIKAIQQQGQKHARCVILIEACEESGSFDLPFYIDLLKDRIGSPNLVICLDSGCGNYDQMWATTSLRGMCMGELKVNILTEGVHSGDASGIVPSSFRIARMLLSRIEDEQTGRMIDDFQVEIPQQRLEQAKGIANTLGDQVFDKFPWVSGARPMSDDRVECVLNRTWRPTVSVTGAEGFPKLVEAGNVLRPESSFKISVRLPPTLAPEAAINRMKEVLEKDPPYGAHVEFKADKAAPGWNAPSLAEWLINASDSASKTFYGKETCYMGEGGSIPFMGMLGEKFPEAQFLITGVLGPNSNAHGPNEFLHIPYAKKLTCCVAHVLADHAKV